MPSTEALRESVVARATAAMAICADGAIELQGMIDSAPAATWDELIEMYQRISALVGRDDV